MTVWAIVKFAVRLVTCKFVNGWKKGKRNKVGVTAVFLFPSFFFEISDFFVCCWKFLFGKGVDDG